MADKKPSKKSITVAPKTTKIEKPVVTASVDAKGTVKVAVKKAPAAKKTAPAKKVAAKKTTAPKPAANSINVLRNKTRDIISDAMRD